MCNDSRNNLDNFDQVGCLQGKCRGLDSWRIKHVFYVINIIKILAISLVSQRIQLPFGESKLVLCVLTKKGEYVRKRTLTSVICNLPRVILFAVLTLFYHFQRHVIGAYINKSGHTTNRLIHCIGCISHVFGMYLIRVATTFLIANNAPLLGFRLSINAVSALLHCQLAYECLLRVHVYKCL